MVRWLSASVGVAERSELVFVSDHSSSCVELPVPLASSAAFELRKYSVPPAEDEPRPFGEIAGQTVNPGFPASAPLVSNCTTVCVAAPEASAAFENA